MKAGTQNHLKMKRLQKMLGVPLYQAVGVLESLWLLCQDCCDDGRIGKYTDQEIADYLEWEGDATELQTCLLKSGWTDQDDAGRPAVHDWTEHCPEFIKERLRKREARRIKDLGIVRTGQARTSPDRTGQGRDKPPLVPSIPNQSQPNPTNPTTCGETEIPSSPPVPKGEPAVLEFPCDGTPNAWRLTPSQLDEWRTLFPSLDLLAECRSALAWVLASANRRKTARGMPKFLVGWFGRAQNANGRRYGSGGTESVPPRGAVPPSPQKIAEDRFYRAQVVIDRGRRQKKSDAEIESDLVAAGFDPREAYAAAPMTHEPKPTR